MFAREVEKVDKKRVGRRRQMTKTLCHLPSLSYLAHEGAIVQQKHYVPCEDSCAEEKAYQGKRWKRDGKTVSGL
jgi:hypothetical protein